MAELKQSESRSRKAGARRIKKSSTRVDLTPMVDLGFLLITFFILTTTWSKPKAMQLGMPADGNSTTIGANAVLTLMATGDNRVFYYQGDLAGALRDGQYGITGYSLSGGIGDIILRKQLEMDRNYKGGRKEMILLIKPSPGSSYKNVVGLLDETLINKVGRYAILDLSGTEKALLAEKKL